MKELVSKLLNIGDDIVMEALNKYMPLNSAKMILITDTGKNELMDPRYLNRPLYISNAMDQLVLECLPEFMAENSLDFDGVIERKDEKKKFLNNLVRILFEKLQNEVAKYRKNYLLKYLVNINESLLWDREHDGIVVPAKLLCLADTPQKRESYHEHERILTESSLAARCLTEFVVSQNFEGGQFIAGYAEIEHMMAIMQAIITFGSQSDSLHYGLADVKVEKLKSGRYAITDDTFQDGMEEFSKAYIEEDISRHISAFPNRLNITSPIEQDKQQKPANPTAISADDVNYAFLNDWGITFSDIDSFCFGCYNLCLRKCTSALDIDAMSFVDELIASQQNLTSDKVMLCINHFSLSERDSYLSAPAGYKNHEVFPWIYNREFSYIRRFILSYKTKEGDCRYVFGPRSAMSSLRQLSTLLSDGRLQDDTQHLKALRSKFNNIKGKAFNEDVRLFLKKQTNLKVWDWEVTIDVDGNLKAEENYGDIDVLAYDSVRKILFAIECKNTEKARNVKEMKTELDKYFGQPGSNKKGYIQKHIDRHQWLNNNINQVKSFVGEDPEFSIVSIILTSEVIPLSYISKIQPQLPILAFSQLKSKGVDSLIM